MQNKITRVFNKSPTTAVFKQQAEDFRVTEQLGFTPCGQGEHVYLWIEKTGLNTEQVAKDIAKQLGIAARQVAYSGLKDRQALTRQWFSVTWPVKKEFPHLLGDSWQLLEQQRHNKKLRRGSHQSNHFQIILRELQGDTAELEQRLQTIKQQGFANYFGEQRFGYQGQNLVKAKALLAGELKCKPFLRSMYLSAARSYLFNAYLSERVRQGNWNQVLAGDYCNLAGSNSFFVAEQCSEEIAQRAAELDIHPCGPLPGKQVITLPYWQELAEKQQQWLSALQTQGLETQYRPLRCVAKALSWQLDNNQCEISFSLRPGSFATALLNELVSLNNE